MNNKQGVTVNNKRSVKLESWFTNLQQTPLIESADNSKYEYL